ncbi:MAG TPA: hypothetical protein VMS56_10530 [Thermoanaerobaculia bacterium]|nr:hypothetical protein [Thermoanaerobaculia bacterium]
MKPILDQASELQRRVLDQAAGIAREQRVQAWIVGGPVRDALLGRRFGDLDFTLEREAEPFAAELARRLGGTVATFPSFLTARVRLPGGEEVDVATTRAESYGRPGALPAVRPGGLEDDLRRRDVTVNAMAIDLASGSVSDPTGGRADLAAGLLRAIHRRSFIDDPTRILRVLRLGERLGFRPEPETAGWMEDAIGGKALETVSRERRWRELRLALDEPRAAAAVEAMARAAALDSLLGRLRGERERADLLARAERLSRSDPSLDRELLFLHALLEPRDPIPPLEGSGLSSDRAARLVELLGAEAAAERLEAEEEEAAAALLERASGELLALLGERPELGPAVALASRIRQTRLPFGADQLGVAPGPHVGLALRDTRRALAAGALSPDLALAFARERALEYLRSGEGARR